jgi:hypothetical protein
MLGTGQVLLGCCEHRRGLPIPGPVVARFSG